MKDNTPIFRSLEMIEEKLQEKLTVDMLAEAAHFSKYHYQRMFKEAVGDSVMGYVTRRRLSLAAAELAGTNLSVLEVALKYGYDSHEGFTRSFKTYMGVTPMEYRKHHLSTVFPEWRKETRNMSCERNLNDLVIRDEIIRELNNLIVEAKETAAYIRKLTGEMTEAQVYTQFWDYVAQRAEKMAMQTAEALERVAAIAQRPDEISARFLIIKTIEDAAYEAGVTSFQTGLTIARALPEHQEAFRPLCERYDSLAQHSRIKAEKIVQFFSELSALIFQDMRQNGCRKLQACVEAGKAAAETLSDPSLPYSYIAEELLEIVEEFSAAPLEEITVSLLEEALLRLEAVSFASDIDSWRAPAHKSLFDGIADFKAKLTETVEFFRNLPQDTTQSSSPVRTPQKLYSDLAMQEGILLFYLKGEVQKLGDSHLNEEQAAAFEAVCAKLKKAVSLCRRCTDKEEEKEIAALLHQTCQELFQEADGLGAYGGAIRYIAKEAERPLKYLPDC